MSKMDDWLFRGLEPSGPPSELRERTLQAARRAITRPATPDPWARVWQSRTARLAWAAAAMVLLFGHAWVASVPTSGSREGAIPVIVSAASHDQELAEIVGLPRVSSRAATWIHVCDDTTSNNGGDLAPSTTSGSLS